MPLAQGLRQALGLYSFGMLLIGALIVFYHIAAMTAETAHYGTIFGRRANQVWMPIRFVLAIVLLVPVGSSLNAGQYLVIKIAEEGSTLASNAWRMVASVGGEHLSGLVAPRGPDVAQITAAATEMQICRMIYQQTYASMDDSVTRMAGNIDNAVMKIPATRFTGESWRVSNLLNAGTPLCGELRFSGFRRPVFIKVAMADPVALIADTLSTFAHDQADDLLARTHDIAARTAPVFTGALPIAGADIHNDLAAVEEIYRTRLRVESQTIKSTALLVSNGILEDSVHAGWLAAARFLVELIRLQEGLSTLFNHALPMAQEPIFDHPIIARQSLAETLDNLPGLHPLDQEGFGKLVMFYGQVGRMMVQVHGWLYSSQIPEKDFVPPSGFDLRDRLHAGTDPSAAIAIYAQTLDAAALERGVWGVSPDSGDAGYPFVPVMTESGFNPFAALVEFGQRQIDLGVFLTGIAGGAMTSASTAGSAILLGAAAFGFLIGGLVLVFLVPLLPFLRFLLGALAWAVNVFEAVISTPIVALAHLTPGGEGLSGGVARQAYVLWLGLFIRPLLTLFGLAFGLLLFTLSLAFLNTVLMPFAQMAAPSNDGLLTLANTGLVLFYDILVYAAANVSFRGIYWLPDKSLRWLSRFVVTDSGGIFVPAGSDGSGGVSSMLNFFARSSSSSSSSVGVASSSGPSSSDRSPAARHHATKMALFPLYSDKPTQTPGSPVTPQAVPGVNQPPNVKGTVSDPKKPPVRPPTPEERDPSLRRKDREEPLVEDKNKGEDDEDDKDKGKNETQPPKE